MDAVGIIAEVRLNGKPHKPPETVMLFGEMTFSNVLHRLDESLDDENGVEVPVPVPHVPHTAYPTGFSREYATSSDTPPLCWPRGRPQAPTSYYVLPLQATRDLGGHTWQFFWVFGDGRRSCSWRQGKAAMHRQCLMTPDDSTVDTGSA